MRKKIVVMKTKLLDARISSAGSLKQQEAQQRAEQAVAVAAEILQSGGLVAFPTETVYGLGGDALNPQAAKAIYAAKGRPSDNPLIVHIADEAQLALLTERVPEAAQRLMQAFWPGPLTMIFEKKAQVPESTTGGLSTVAVRMPDDAATLALIRRSGKCLAGPSANRSGGPSPTSWEHVLRDLDGRIDAILQGEDCRVGIESTVLDMTGQVPVILRPGWITPEQIAEVTGGKVEMDPALFVNRPRDVSDHSPPPKAPGMKYKHYAPKAEMVVLQGSVAAVRRGAQALVREKEAEGRRAVALLFSDGDPKETARTLFAQLRRCDEEGIEFIAAGAVQGSDSIGFAVMNRMLKSAGYQVLQVADDGSFLKQATGRYVMKIAVAADHGGFLLKEAIKAHLTERGCEVLDLGTHSEASVDYPDYGRACGEAVASGHAERGIVCCGTGIGISIAANKVKGIRAAVVTNEFMAEMTKRHNDANIIALGGRVLDEATALRLVDLWIDTEFEGGRHQRRVDMLNEM